MRTISINHNETVLRGITLNHNETVVLDAPSDDATVDAAPAPSAE